MSSRRDLVEDLLHEVFGGHKRMLYNVGQEYVAKQANVLKDPGVWAFFYVNTLYYDLNKNRVSNAAQLHKSLVEDFHKEIEQWDVEQMPEYASIKHMFISSLNAFTDLRDLKVIFPEALHRVLEKHVDLFSETNPQPEKAKERYEKVKHLHPVILQFMALSLIVE